MSRRSGGVGGGGADLGGGGREMKRTRLTRGEGVWGLVGDGLYGVTLTPCCFAWGERAGFGPCRCCYAPLFFSDGSGVLAFWVLALQKIPSRFRDRSSVNK
jgi:hypothetical protein